MRHSCRAQHSPLDHGHGETNKVNESLRSARHGTIHDIFLLSGALSGVKSWD